MGQPNMNPPDFQTLKDKQRQLRDGFPQDLSLRVHRAISWGLRAEEEVKKEDKDFDAQFIFLWIGFNAAYARNPDAATDEQDTKARGEFQNYFKTLDSCDKEKLISQAVWERYSNEIRLLLNNEFVFSPFWKYHNGIPGYENWKQILKSSWRVINTAMKNRDTAKVLSVLFDRLYVLRNQMIHGGATCKSSYNRDQVRDGAKIMSWLLPIFVDLMMDNPHENWGPPWYPVIEK